MRHGWTNICSEECLLTLGKNQKRRRGDPKKMFCLQVFSDANTQADVLLEESRIGAPTIFENDITV